MTEGLKMAQGSTADASAQTEYPLPLGAKYILDRLAAALLSDGNKGTLTVDVLRDLMTSMGTKLAGEDLDNDALAGMYGCTYALINANATTVIKSGSGVLFGIVLVVAGVTGPPVNTAIFYDNTAGAGTVLVPSFDTTAFAAGTLPRNLDMGGIKFNTGLTCVTANGTCVQMVVLYK